MRMDAKSKINVVYLEGAIEFGGSVKDLINIVKYLDDTKYMPTILFLHSGNHVERARAEICNKAKIIVFNSNLKIVNSKVSLGNASRHYRLYKVLLTRVFHFFSIMRVLKQNNAKLIHLNNGPYYPAVVAAKILRIRVIVHLRSCVSRLTFLTQTMTLLVDHFISVSKAVQMAYETAGVKPEKFALLYDGIDIREVPQQKNIEKIRKEFHMADNDIMIGTIGRLSDKKKGIIYFIEAIPKILDKIPIAKFIIVGGDADPEKRNYLYFKKRITEMNLQEKVILTGFRTDVLQILSCMNLFISTSLDSKDALGEGLPITILEAMLVKTPIIATAVAGVPEIINHNVEGILIPHGDIGAITESTVRLLSDNKLCESLTRKAEERVRQYFNIDSLVMKIDSLYDKYVC